MSIVTTNRAVGIKGDIHSKIGPKVVITSSPQDELLLCHGSIASEVIARTCGIIYVSQSLKEISLWYCDFDRTHSHD
jgi:hypothetical protein